MKFLANKKLAARIGIITSAITLAGMLMLWVIVSTNPPPAAVPAPSKREP